KLARKVTGRKRIMSFTNGFHGMTLGSLAITGNLSKRAGGQVELDNAVTMPFDQFISTKESLNLVEQYVCSCGSGVELPAAIIVETVQGEGGISAPSTEWLQGIEKVAKKHDTLVIVDDMQAGFGRTGTLFSFDPAGLEPHIVCLS